MANKPLTLRTANQSDVPSIISLLLTSFRRFPLFNYLYSPLKENPDNAHDTIYFWSRRVSLAIWDPSATVVLAELDAGDDKGVAAVREGDRLSEVDAESWTMLEWIKGSTELEQVSRSTGRMVVGFAIWRWKGGIELREKGASEVTLFESLQKARVNFELWYYGKFYVRKDQDRDRYSHYLKSEDELQQSNDKEPQLYLDNLCADFRVQRRGVGRALVEWGKDKAHHQGVPINTETNPENVAFYEKLGFQEVGKWGVHTPDPLRKVELSILQCKSR